LVSDIPAGDGNFEKLFLRCSPASYKYGSKSFNAVVVIGRSDPPGLQQHIFTEIRVGIY
jgi:hypothetical protein